MKRESQREKRGKERVIKEMGRDRMNEGGVWERGGFGRGNIL